MVSDAEKNIGVIILAGGDSQRMGFPKLFLPYSAGQTFIEKIVSTYQDVCDKIIVVINKKNLRPPLKNCILALSPKCKITPNNKPHLGRVYSIKLGLSQLKKVDFCFIQNSDAPFVPKKTLQKLIRNGNKESYTKPVYRGKGGHPVLISQKIIQRILKTTGRKITLRDVLKKFPVVEAETKSKGVIIDINTPAEYNRFFPQYKKKQYFGQFKKNGTKVPLNAEFFCNPAINGGVSDKTRIIQGLQPFISNILKKKCPKYWKNKILIKLWKKELQS